MTKFEEIAKSGQRHSSWVVPFFRPKRTVLIAKRSDSVNNPKLWNLFGGNVEPGASVLKTARKEFHEEAGIKIPSEALISLGKTTTHTKGEKFFMHYFVFEANDEFRPVLNNENTKSKWVAIDDLDDWMHSARAHRSLRNFRYVLDGMLEGKKEPDKKVKAKGDKDKKPKKERPDKENAQ
jgi:8-oxo-dGTP pyrophosphatase MutT (NUDIX family)